MSHRRSDSRILQYCILTQWTGRRPHRSTALECSAGIISCAGLILILMQIVLLAVLTGGFFVIIYYVDRDEDLKQYVKGARRRGKVAATRNAGGTVWDGCGSYLRKYSRRFKRADSDPEKRLGAQDPSLQ